MEGVLRHTTTRMIAGVSLSSTTLVSDTIRCRPRYEIRFRPCSQLDFCHFLMGQAA